MTDTARPRFLPLILWGLLGLALGVQVIRMRLAEGAVRDGNGAAAASIRPQNGWGRALAAERLLEQNQVDRSIAESLAALNHTPLAVVALRTLAEAREKKSGPGAGESAWQAAATMGWRDQRTQLWGVLRALANGEAPILAMRADALLRTGDENGRLSVLVRSFMREPEVRTAFVERLALNPGWRRHFLTTALGQRGDDLDGLVATLRDLAASKSPPTRAEIRMAVQGLIARRRFADAASLHAIVAGRPPVFDDGGFGRTDQFYRFASSPFDWVIHEVSHSTASLDESEGRSMTVSTVGVAAQSALERYVPLPPGNYRLAFSVRGEPQSPAMLGVRLHCAPDQRPIAESPRAPLASRSWQQRELAFRTGPDCPVVLIGIGGYGAEAGEAQFDNFRLGRM